MKIYDLFITARHVNGTTTSHEVYVGGYRTLEKAEEAQRNLIKNDVVDSVADTYISVDVLAQDGDYTEGKVTPNDLKNNSYKIIEQVSHVVKDEDGNDVSRVFYRTKTIDEPVEWDE